MAYEKTIWVNGGPPGISAANMNKIEQGIEEAHTQMAELATKDELKTHKEDNVQQTNERQTPHGLPKCNFNSNTIPMNNDDITKNYTNGSIWINEGSGDVFICTNNASGNAVWIKVNYSLIEYIYTEGLESKAFEVGDIYDYNGFKEGYVEYSKEIDHLYLYAKGGYDSTVGSTAFVTYETQNSIDFSNISSINFDMSIDEAEGGPGNKEVYIGLIDTAHSGDYDDLTAYIKFTDIKNRGVVTIDTKNLSGYYYVKISCMAINSRTINAKIYNIWGE